jgi:undecaprenyl-diphosphatase
MLNIIKAIIFGIVEGITEWLPVSSTGHMILLEEFLRFTDVTPGFWEMFLVVIQLGAIMAVVILFWQQIFPIGKQTMGSRGLLSYLKTDILILWLKILTACIPAAIIGLLFDEYFESLFYNSFSVALALIIFGIGFIIIEKRNKNQTPKINSLADITYQTAIFIGAFQLIAAVFPGTSRSGATILGALLIGVSRTIAAEFTFFLAIPVMAGASLLKLIRFGFDFTSTEAAILLAGMVTAFFVSIAVIRFLLGYIRKNDFKIFGWYRIVLGMLILLYFSVF